jgi:hypothetical protein
MSMAKRHRMRVNFCPKLIQALRRPRHACRNFASTVSPGADNACLLEAKFPKVHPFHGRIARLS